MKNIIKITALCLSVIIIETIHSFSLWESAKNKARSGYESVKQGWEELDDSTKNAIIGVGAATAATAVAAGAGYAGYKAYEGGHSSGSGVGPSQEGLLIKRSLKNPEKTVQQELIEFSREYPEIGIPAPAQPQVNPNPAKQGYAPPRPYRDPATVKRSTPPKPVLRDVSTPVLPTAQQREIGEIFAIEE